MTVKSWTEFRLFAQSGEFIAIIASEKDAVQWAKEQRVVKQNPKLKFICKEISIAELPKRKFFV